MTLGGPVTLFSPNGRRMRNMTGICVLAITAVALQGCSSSGSVAANGPVRATAPATGSGTATASGTATTGTATGTGPTATPTGVPSSTASAPVSTVQTASDSWTPQGQLANPVPIDTVVNADKSLTATYPKGAPVGQALTIKLQAARNSSGKLVVHFSADNQSGQKISLMMGMFGNASAVDDQGNGLQLEEMDSAWTLQDNSDGVGDMIPGQPLHGDIVIDAPASGSTFSMYWDQAVGNGAGGSMTGIILIRDIPIS